MNAWHHSAGSSHARGYGWKWQQVRVAVLKRDRYVCQCSVCKSSGRVRVASEVDHIVPKAQGGSDAMDNLQAINAQCHRDKGLQDRGYRVPQWIGLDGWPR